jgi:hypothetical protein
LIYEIVGEDLRKVAQKVRKDIRAARRAHCDLAKKYNMGTSFYISGDSISRRVRAFTPNEKSRRAPDPKLWRCRPDGRSWVPNMKTPEGRRLRVEIDSLPSLSAKPLADAVGFTYKFHDGILYSLGYSLNRNGYYSIKIPEFSKADVAMDPDLRYKAAKGLRRITARQHAEKSLLTKAQYLKTPK